MKYSILILLLELAVIFATTGINYAENMRVIQSSIHPNIEEPNWQAISSGGIIGAVSPNIQLTGTVGQAIIGTGESDDFGVVQGFWQWFIGIGPCGDANGDDEINVGDAVFLINYVFKGGDPPEPQCIGDANGDGGVNVGDAVYLIAYVFKGGPPPVDDCCP